MVRKVFLVCALHFSIASSLILNLPTAADPSSDPSGIHIAPIRSEDPRSRLPEPTSSLSLSNATKAADNATLNALDFSCNGARFFRPISASYASCLDAFEYIHYGDSTKTFGDRASGDWGFVLPHRWLSDDGLCFFEYDITQSEIFDVNNLNGLKAAAQAMLNSCVGNQNRGGVVTGIGRYGHLKITVKPYSPSVRCTASDRPAVADMCDHILYDMPASKTQQLFGNHGSAGIDVELPWTMITTEMQCVLRVRMINGQSSGPAIRTSWYDIWQQAVALSTLCAHKGQDGHAFLQDEGQRRMVISFRNENVTNAASDDTS